MLMSVKTNWSSLALQSYLMFDVGMAKLTDYQVIIRVGPK